MPDLTNIKGTQFHTAELREYPYSSVVGNGIIVILEGHGVITQLSIMIPSTKHNKKAVALAVAEALMNATEGKLELQLPVGWDKNG